MEKEFRIKAKDGKQIYCKLRGSLEKPVIVFVHGFTGHMDEHLFYNAARFFEKKGFASLRFNLYGDQDDARKLHECDLQTHAADLDRVVSYLKKKKAQDIFAVGHSYGGPTIFLSDTKNYRALVLWDASFHFKALFKNKEYSKELKGFCKEWAFKFFIGQKFVTEAEKLEKTFWQTVSQNKAPTKVVLTENGNARSPLKKDFFTALNEPKEMLEMKKTGHTFSEDTAAEKLFQETLKWLRKFGKK
ncbi:MAG: alpha/beta fold hydrolase [Candidatus Moranbacteria bacterium]|nr:alpha/beta fold hydrolase [Candidatus Moranbacteria bacterium]